MTRARQTLATVDTLQAEFEGAIGSDTFQGTLALKRPNLGKIEITGSEGLGTFRVSSDGKEVLTYFPADNQFTKIRPGPKGEHISAFIVEHVQHFFRPEAVAHVPTHGAATLATDSTVNSADYRVVDVSPATANRTTRYFISEHDGLIHRIAYHRAGHDDAAGNFIQLKKIRTNEPLSSESFAWRLPPGATRLHMPVSIDLFNTKEDAAPGAGGGH